MFAVVLLALLISVPVRAELRDPNNSADYIILTNQEVLSNNVWIDSLLDYRAAQGRVSMAVTVEEIWAEFTPAGSDSAIREFLHYAYDNWQTPRLKDVFIVGHEDIVPSHTHQGLALHIFLSDYFYVMPDDSLSFSPMFHIGRLPWRSTYSEPLGNFFRKIVAFETALDTDWLDKCHLIADSTCQLTGDCESWVENLSQALDQELLFERDYLGRPVEDAAYGDRQTVLENLNQGNFLTCYSGNSLGYTLLNEEQISSEDLALLSNLDRLTVLCGTISFGLGQDSLGTLPIYFGAMNASNGGAIAALAYSSEPWYHASRQLTSEIGNSMVDDEALTIGSAWSMGCTAFIDAYAPGAPHPGPSWDMLQGTFLLGDPATRIPGRITSTDPITAPVVPTTIQIVGNYPNPFNPSTTINFMLNRAGSARLTVYDITGRAVTTLAEQSFTAGQHSIVWNATGQASGMYLVRLESAGQFSTHRVTLLK